jgi:tryptophanyl-tRNA synthetase
MLDKNDKKWLEEMIEKKIKKALTVKVKMERRRDINTGQPLSTPIMEILDIYLPDFWVEYLPYYEGAMRGVQETTDHVKNKINSHSATLEIMGKIMIDTEKAIMAIARLAQKIERVNWEKNEQFLLEEPIDVKEEA